ncbi:hypothetical protein [Psychrobacter pygoscelis]|uniref:hypothetical protein n=1 Tax=Psychrobacter pygoscelis TaxID=2488563 RepID=UPI00103BE4C1|nr:hypothetical protein [Psychrobacter pygoscelis]
MCCCQPTINTGCIDLATKKSRSTSHCYFNNELLNSAQTHAIVRSEYEQVWDMLRTQTDGITIRDIPRTVTGVSYYKAQAWLLTLLEAGYVHRQEISRKFKLPTYRYTLARDIGQQPPNLDSHGQPRPPSMNEVVWRTARILQTFNANQILASGSTPELTLKLSAVRQYLRQLYLAGYLELREPGRSKKLAVYRLRVNTGPKPPQIKRGKKVYDANLGLIVFDPQTPLPPSHQNKEANHV